MTDNIELVIAAIPQTMESNHPHCLCIPLVSRKLDQFGRLPPKNNHNME